MKKQNKMDKKGLAPSSSKGFTLIEVILVLAIGGLIFLLAFLAFQQVSRNRRDTQRRSDAGRVLAELQNYASDHNGAYPGLGTGTNVHFPAGAAATGDGIPVKQFVNNYLGGSSLVDPRGDLYQVGIGGGGAYAALSAVPSSRILMYAPDSACSGGDTMIAPETGVIAVAVGLESGSFACRDSK